jgi:hypothetical protein
MARDFAVPGVRQLYSRFPAVYRTTSWDEMVRLARIGKQDEAAELGKKVSSRSRQINAQNVLARKVRVNRMALFSLQAAMAEELRDILQATSEAAELEARRWNGKASGLKDMRKALGSVTASMRRSLNKWVTDGVWQSILLGVRNTEDAMVDVFKQNEEAYHPDLGAERELMEDRLAVGLSTSLTSRGKPKLESARYHQVVDKLYEKLVKKGLDGLRPSDSVWELSKRTELEMNRLLQRGISNGKSARDIAKELADFLDPSIGKKGAELGRGVYTKPMKNALRLARTETNRAYAGATSEWARTRSWVKGIMITLSSAHDPTAEEDECDRWAGKVVSPDKFEELVPFHPHCMCYGTMVIKDEYLEPQGAATGKDEED